MRPGVSGEAARVDNESFAFVRRSAEPASMSLRLPSTLDAWGREDFTQVLRDELLRCDALFAPLQRALAHGSHALVERAQLMLLRGVEQDGVLQFEVGASYASITPGCACEADPTPMSELVEFATLRIRIERAGADACVQLLDN